MGEIGEGNALKKAVGYGFHSNELRELAGSMFGGLSLEDQCRMVEIRQMDHFPYQINGEQAGPTIDFVVEALNFMLGDACFACEMEGEEDVVLTNNSCPCCHAIFGMAPRLLAHVAAHILYDSSINQADEPCSLCLLPDCSEEV